MTNHIVDVDKLKVFVDELEKTLTYHEEQERYYLRTANRLRKQLNAAKKALDALLEFKLYEVKANDRS